MTTQHYTPENFETCLIGLLLARAALLKDRLLDTHLEPYGVTAAQFKVLIIMAQFAVDTPAELCRYLSVDSGSMTRMLDRLEQKNLLERRRCDNDRRQVRLELSGEGKALADRLPQIGAEAMNAFTGVLDAQELASLEHTLKKVLLAAGDPLTVMRLGEK